MQTKPLPFFFFLVVLTLASTLRAAHADSTANFIQDTTPPHKTAPLVFVDADGIQHALADYRGRFVLLNVWATWCVPCVKEMPSLDALQKNFDPQKLIVLPLSEDRDKASVSAFYEKHAIIHLPVAVDTAGIAPNSLRLQGFPTTLLIDPQGIEIAHMEGDAKWDSPEFLAYINQHIHSAGDGAVK